jgi:hypothetical protein
MAYHDGDLNQILADLRAYAEALRIEWEAKNPVWIPSWIEKFEALDFYASQGVYPDEWV